MDTIEDIVRGYVPLLYGESAKGWHAVYCEVCGDGTHSKGPRGGWLFTEESCFYNCFNCAIDGNFDPNREIPHSKEMWNILRAFGIPKNDISALLTTKLKDTKLGIKRRPKIHLPIIDIPDYFKLLTEFDDDNPLAAEARDVLWDRYNMTQDDFPFFLSTGETKSKDTEDIFLARNLLPRIIIPAYNGKNLMYWQARLFFGENNKKYISASVEDSNSVMYGLNHLHIENPEDNPLYITEGFFDSWHVNGIAVIANNLKSGKIELLSRSKRPKIVIPDYNKDGMHLADNAIAEGWGVALPETLPCVDLCKAIKTFGKLYVLKSVADNSYYGIEAKLRLKQFKIENYKLLS